MEFCTAVPVAMARGERKAPPDIIHAPHLNEEPKAATKEEEIGGQIECNRGDRAAAQEGDSNLPAEAAGTPTSSLNETDDQLPGPPPESATASPPEQSTVRASMSSAAAPTTSAPLQALMIHASMNELRKMLGPVLEGDDPVPVSNDAEIPRTKKESADAISPQADLSMSIASNATPTSLNEALPKRQKMNNPENIPIAQSTVAALDTGSSALAECAAAAAASETSTPALATCAATTMVCAAATPSGSQTGAPAGPTETGTKQSRTQIMEAALSVLYSSGSTEQQTPSAPVPVVMGSPVQGDSSCGPYLSSNTHPSMTAMARPLQSAQMPPHMPMPMPMRVPMQQQVPMSQHMLQQVPEQGTAHQQMQPFYLPSQQDMPPRSCVAPQPCIAPQSCMASQPGMPQQPGMLPQSCMASQQILLPQPQQAMPAQMLPPHQAMPTMAYPQPMPTPQSVPQDQVLQRPAMMTPQHSMSQEQMMQQPTMMPQQYLGVALPQGSHVPQVPSSLPRRAASMRASFPVVLCLRPHPAPRTHPRLPLHIFQSRAFHIKHAGIQRKLGASSVASRQRGLH